MSMFNIDELLRSYSPEELAALFTDELNAANKKSAAKVDELNEILSSLTEWTIKYYPSTEADAEKLRADVKESANMIIQLLDNVVDCTKEKGANIMNSFFETFNI